MNKYNGRLIMAFFISLLVLFSPVLIVAEEMSIPSLLGEYEGEKTDGEYYILKDMDTQKVIDQMSRIVYEGDELILEDNSHYRVVQVENDVALCEYLGQEELVLTSPVFGALAEKTKKKEEGTIGIYMTHSAESYVPSSGTESKPGNGDIINVGKLIADVLEEKGVNVSFSNHSHDPHDANAYYRSRRTAAQLLKDNPIVLIDVHRDGVPDPNFYAKEINGKDAVQIRLVVGRQNQKMQDNMEFANQMKAYYDETVPGLIKGIFKAKGNYNQDIGPRAILIEVGTHTNSIEEAKNGAAIFATYLPDFLNLGTSGKGGKAPAGQTGRGALSSILWLLVISIIGTMVFLFISTGSIEGTVDKVKNFSKEFTGNTLALGRKNKK